MNYFNFNIGDYAQATTGLSFLEDAIYTRLLRKYYTDESPLDGELKTIGRAIGARSEDELEALDYVLTTFFKLKSGKWHNTRADYEIEEYREKLRKAAEAGKASAKSRKAKQVLADFSAESNNRSTTVEQQLNECSTTVQPTKNQEPRTSNQEPKKSQSGTSSRDVTLTQWLDSCEAAGEPHLPDSDPIFNYPDGKPLPREWLCAAWFAFCEQYLDGSGAEKKYTDWRAVFRSSVRKDWLKLWRSDKGQWALTSAGEMALQNWRAQ